jgi:predicted nucleic acid-binding protein
MSDRAFVDTNVLVYAHDAGAGERHRIAAALVRELWESRRGVLSTQVLQEAWVNLRKKAARPVSREEALALIEDYARWEVIVNTAGSVIEAIRLEERFGLSFWDALIVQAAQSAAVETLYSEDLSAGQRFGTVRVVDPFA